MKKTNTSQWPGIAAMLFALAAPFVLSLCSDSAVPPRKSHNYRDDRQCIDSTKIDLYRPCILILAPVCGCNNVTYGNYCEAERNGVLRWKDGPCKK